MKNERRSVILVVDDHKANRDLIGASLGAAYDLLEAPDGAQALTLMDRQLVDLVLLDVMRPHLGGYEVCRKIKERHHDQYLPVILLTALAQQDDRNAGLEAGADDFLTKPVDRTELHLRVQAFIKLKQQDESIRAQLADRWRQEQLIRDQMEELQAVDALNDDLVSLLMHDLRKPLAGVMSLHDHAGPSASGEHLRNDARMGMGGSGRLREITEDILQISLLESGTVPMRPERLEVASVVREAIASMWGAARARQVDISPIMDLTTLEIAADRKLLRRAVENLLSNALKYSPFGGVILTTVQNVDDHVEIEVGDRGSGIPDDLKARIFEKFGSVAVTGGNQRRAIGLGLYLVNLVATAHGGRTLVRDRKGGGTTFGLWLPNQEMLRV